MTVPALNRNGMNLLTTERPLSVPVAFGPPGPQGEIGPQGPEGDIYQVSGWGAYVHTGAAQAIAGGVKATLANNRGAVLEMEKPSDVATFYDGSVIPGRNGDGVAIGIEFTFTPSSGASSAIVVSIDIGGAVGELYSQEYAILKGGGIPHRVAYTATAYMLGTWAANGGTVKVICDGPGEVTAVRYVIQRLHKAKP
jgi:hypothetical protein